MTRRRLVLSVVAATVVAALAAVGVYALLGGADGSSGTPSGPSLTPVPTLDPAHLSYTGFDDAVVALADLRGKPVVLNFFGSWCAPCLKEMPAFEAVHKALGDKVTFVGLAYNDRPEEALKVVETTGVTYQVGRDLNGALLEHFKGIKMPTTVILDSAGEVVTTHSGELSGNQLTALLAKVT
jgi:thiol-disulfide isomerase/thioredoxin